MRGTGRATFAAILLLIAGALGDIFGGANQWPSLALFLLCVSGSSTASSLSETASASCEFEPSRTR